MHPSANWLPFCLPKHEYYSDLMCFSAAADVDTTSFGAAARVPYLYLVTEPHHADPHTSARHVTTHTAGTNSNHAQAWPTLKRGMSAAARTIKSCGFAQLIQRTHICTCCTKRDIMSNERLRQPHDQSTEREEKNATQTQQQHAHRMVEVPFTKAIVNHLLRNVGGTNPQHHLHHDEKVLESHECPHSPDL